MLFFPEAVFFIKIRGLEIPAAFHSSPFTVKIFACKSNAAKDTVKRCLHKDTDLPFSPHHHAKNTGHHTPNCNGLIFGMEIIGDTASVAQGQNSGKIDSHKIIFLCAEIRRCCQIIILRDILRFTDPS